MSAKPLIYLDNNATTMAAPEVVSAMTEMLSTHYGNPSSLHHFARVAGAAVKHARTQLADLLGCRSAELLFTSGSTEAITTAFASAMSAKPGGHIVTTAVEHPAVLRNAEKYESSGSRLTLVPVDDGGQLSAEQFIAALSEDTALAAVMVANNETGVVFPVEAIVEACRARKIPVLLDASQAAGKLPLDIKALKPDYVAVSAHKFHGPKGIGALYLRRGAPFEPLLIGGGQERSRRSGTENVPAIVAMGVAAQLAKQRLESGEMERLRILRDKLEAGILATLPNARVNGRGERLPNTLNVSFVHASGEAILQHLDELGIAASSSSACSSNEQEPSHVLRAMRVPESHIHGSMRVGLSAYTTDDEVDYLLSVLPRVIEQARAASPFVGNDLADDYVESSRKDDPLYCDC
ncbi:MAG: aminotransferase class V-fold PLP-dependent enzyme [Myxococcales bacterium]|nr:aminotransferase class V-fold PLP-dependent enzyme [Myxococcales bacterium]